MNFFSQSVDTKKASDTYNAGSIEVLKDLEPVKRRPGMYTDTTSPDHLAFEVIDNSVDEAIAGYANQIDVVLKKDFSILIVDNGRGMPIDIHPDEKISGVELIMMKLHAGAKFSNKGYMYSGGLHGVGVSVVNALSLKLSINIKRNGYQYSISFSNGFKTHELEKIGKIDKKKTGTSVWFYPEPQYFDTKFFSTKALKATLKSKAVLCKGLTTTFFNEATGEKKKWKYDLGLNEYLDNNIKGQECILSSCFSGDIKDEDIHITWAVNWTKQPFANIEESYVNLIPTQLGGTHVNGFRSGLLESVREFCKFQNLLPKGLYLVPDDIFMNISYILLVKLGDPQFSGQTKERLLSRHCANLVNIKIRDALSLWMNRNVEKSKKLASFVIENAKTRIKKSKKVTKKRTINGTSLPSKLSDCTSDDQQIRELFFVEGDSAGGSARQARDRRFQAVMPLRGKILNTWNIESSSIIESKEIMDISKVLGVLPGSEDISKLRYNKICILADADSDGLHIATLLCALFFKHFYKLIEYGHIYVAMPPLYRIDMANDVYYALDAPEKDNIIKRLKRRKNYGKLNIQRFKGLGEMNPSQLRETTLASDSRRLVKLYTNDENSIQDYETMNMLLCKKRAKDRKIWIETNGNLKEIY